MICPVCKCEYLTGVTQCSDCDVPLVDALDTAILVSPEDGNIVSIWYGDDPRKFALIKEGLEKAGIPFMGPVPTGYFIFPSMRPKMEVAVSAADRERAEKVILELEPRDDDPDELTQEERNTLVLPESEGIDYGKAAGDWSDVPQNWDDDVPASEVWNGEEEDFADTLIACLRENDIPSRKLAEGSGWRLVVRPEQVVRAREIVREVVEASPPR